MDEMAGFHFGRVAGEEEEEEEEGFLGFIEALRGYLSFWRRWRAVVVMVMVMVEVKDGGIPLVLCGEGHGRERLQCSDRLR